MTTAISGDVSIFELDAAVEPLETIDGDALDAANQYSPAIPVGFNQFLFNGLDAEKPIGTVERKGKQVLEVTYSATHIKADGTEGKTVNFQRVNGYKSEKMRSSSLGELIHALGLTTEFNKTTKKASDVLALLQGAEGARTTFRARVTWRHYDKETQTTTTTNPRTYVNGKGETVVEVGWPKNDDGTLARHPGNEELSGFSPASKK